MDKDVICAQESEIDLNLENYSISEYIPVSVKTQLSPVLDFINQLLPKMDQYSSDLKKIVSKLLNDVLENCMQLIKFLINKGISGFLDKYQS